MSTAYWRVDSALSILVNFWTTVPILSVLSIGLFSFIYLLALDLLVFEFFLTFEFSQLTEPVQIATYKAIIN